MTNITVFTDKAPTLEELQKLVGGYIEVVESLDGEADIVLDEEGKLKGKEVNESATKLWLGDDKADWFDVLVGDVAVCRGKARLA
tara:strand:- start:147 stop:401 length:255 start_codon:yes stop_codon:yes gene_type:complete